MSLKDYIRIFKRHKWWIIGWFCLITIGYLFYENQIKDRKYESSLVFSVNKKALGFVVEKKEDSLSGFTETPLNMEKLKTDMLGEVIIGKALAKYSVMAENNQDKNFDGPHALGQSPYPIFEGKQFDENQKKFRKCISISLNPKDESFTVKANSTNEYKSQWMIQALVEAFKEHKKGEALKSMKREVDLNLRTLAEDRRIKREKIEMRRIEVDKLEKKYGKHVIWEDGPERKLEEREKILEKGILVDEDILGIQSEIKEFESYSSDRWLIEEGKDNKIVELQNDLYAKREGVQQELARLRVDFTDRHPVVLKKLAELESLSTAFPKLAAEIIERNISKRKRKLENKLVIRKKLARDLERANREIDVIKENKQFFKSIEERIKSKTESIELLERRNEIIKVQIGVADDPIAVITPSKLGKRANRTPNTRYYVMLFGIIIGLGFAYLLEYIDDTIRTPHDVEKFVGLRVIGTVPLLRKNEEKLLHRIALKSPISEMMNTLSMILQSWMLKMKGQVMLIVSSKPGEGKSTFVTNLAVALCRGGEKVVLIDSDLRKPSLHRFFGVDNSVGLSNFLEDSFAEDVEDTDEAKIAKIVHHTDVEGLFMIPSGPIPSNPVGLLKSENIDRLLNHLKTYIGIILIDTPPLAMIDAGVLATKVNAVVTVMDAGKVTKREALAGKHLIENVGGNNLGVILNKVTLEGEEYYYYFEGYSYYYGSSRNRKKKSV